MAHAGAAAPAAPAATAATAPLDATTLSRRLRWKAVVAGGLSNNGLDPVPNGEALQRAHTVQSGDRSCMGGLAGAHHVPSFTCCVACVALAASPVLGAADFAASNAWRCFVCCGEPKPHCWSQATVMQTIIQDVRDAGHKFYLANGGVYSQGRKRWLCYNRWLKACLPESPTAGKPGQLPIPLCVQAVFRAAFQNPAAMPYTGHGVYLGQPII